MTEKQRRFVAEYVKEPVGAVAARRAGYAVKNAAQVASRLLKEPEIREALRGIVEVYAGAEPEEVLREVRAVAFASASDENGSKVKYSSKLRALELLGKNMGLFEPGAAKNEKEPVVIIDQISPGGEGA